MADVAVGFLLQNLQQLVEHNAALISGVKEQVVLLSNELSMLKAVLKDLTEKRNEAEVVKELVRQIQVVVHQGDHVIDTFNAHTALQRSRNTISKVIHGIDDLAKLLAVAKEIQSVRKNVGEIYRMQSFGLGVIQQQGKRSGHLNSGVEEQVVHLSNELSMLKAVHKDLTEKRSEYEVVKELVRQIQVVVHQGDHVIDTFAAHTAFQRSRNTISKVIHGIDCLVKLLAVAKEIQWIRKNVGEIYRMQSFGLGVIQQQEKRSGRGLPEKKAPVVEEENVVGFDKEAETLVDRLNGGKAEMEVVSVIGMGGLRLESDPIVGCGGDYSAGWGYKFGGYSRGAIGGSR